MERKVWRLLGALVMAVFLLAGGASAWARMAVQTRNEQQVFWQSIKTVEVDSGSAQVSLDAGAPDRVTVRDTMDWALRRPSVATELRGTTLKVAVSCISPLGLFPCGVRLDIQVPAATAVHVRSSSGSTQVSGVSGEVWATTTSGRVRLEGVSGPIRVQATSGRIDAAELSSTEVRASAWSGRVALAFARPPRTVTVTTMSGPVAVVVPARQVRYRVGGLSTSGAWQIDPTVVGSASPRSVDVTTTSGPVSVLSDPTAADTDPGLWPSPAPSLPLTPFPTPAVSRSAGATPPGGGQ